VLICVFLRLFVLELGARIRDGRTDGRTGTTHNAADSFFSFKAASAHFTSNCLLQKSLPTLNLVGMPRNPRVAFFIRRLTADAYRTGGQGGSRPPWIWETSKIPADGMRNSGIQGTEFF